MTSRPGDHGAPVDSSELDVLRRQLDREQTARREAESLLEDKSRELWEANAALGQAVSKLQELSAHDPLTGLSNRRALDDWVASRRTHQVRSGNLVGVLLVDVDHFKGINDQHGHAAGDQVLRAIAQRMTAQVRADDLVVRLGGDELVVMLAGVRDLASCVRVGQKIHDAVGQPLGLDEETLSPSVSIGAAVMPADGDLEDAMRRADAALYRAKDAGRGVVAPADPT